MTDKITDEEITSYINYYYTEAAIQELEGHLLSILKKRQEIYPSEKNDREWLEFSDWVCKRKNDEKTQRLSNLSTTLKTYCGRTFFEGKFENKQISL